MSLCKMSPQGRPIRSNLACSACADPGCSPDLSRPAGSRTPPDPLDHSADRRAGSSKPNFEQSNAHPHAVLLKGAICWQEPAAGLAIDLGFYRFSCCCSGRS